MKVLYLTQWFDPEPAFKGLAFARALAASGMDVEVATGFPNYPGGRLYSGYRLQPWRRETMDGLVVHRLWLYPSHDGSGLRRAFNYLSFFVSSLLFGLLRAHRYDVIYVYHPPITPALAAALFARLWRKPFIVEIQDLWPDSALGSGMLPRRLGRMLSLVCDYVHRRAARVVAQSSGIRDQLAARGVPENRLSVVYNWSNYRPGAAGAPTAELPFGPGTVNFAYGGNLGQAQALGTVIAAAALARRAVPNLCLHLFGEGIERKELTALAAAQPDGAVIVHGPVPRERMDRIFEQSDALVVHLADDPLFAITIPSKLQHYLSCGRPVIAGLAGEAASMIREAACGLVSPPEDIAAMARNMVEMARLPSDERVKLGENGRLFYQRSMSFEQAVAKTVDIISDSVR